VSQRIQLSVTLTYQSLEDPSSRLLIACMLGLMERKGSPPFGAKISSDFEALCERTERTDRVSTYCLVLPTLEQKKPVMEFYSRVQLRTGEIAL
jgi:hypothetical protein